MPVSQREAYIMVLFIFLAGLINEEVEILLTVFIKVVNEKISSGDFLIDYCS